MSLVDKMKQIGADAVGASNPVAVLFGTVTKESPLEVNVEQRMTLPRDFFVIPYSLPPLIIGDRLILLRVQGGQDYVILDKVVD